jgi:hypothetical protein
MKTYKIYKNSSGQVEAVKQGWSWPGFFFTSIWCLVKGLYGLGAGLLIAFLIARVMSVESEAINALTSLAGLGVAIWLGVSGNEMRGKKLQGKGYEFVSTIDANSPEDAVAEFAKKGSHLASSVPANQSQTKESPITGHCSKCNKPLTEEESHKFLGKIYCREHYEQAIG